MTTTYTTNKNLGEPAVGDTGWGTTINTSITAIDNAFGGKTTLTVTGVSGTVTLTASQYQVLYLYITGTLTANVTYSIPSGVGGQWTVYNNTTGSYTVTISSAGGGASYTIVQSGRTVLLSDGTNIVQSTPSVGGSTTQVQYNNNGIITGSSNFTFDGTNIALAGTMAMGSPFLRNRLINGSMQIAQYGTSASLANGAVGYVCCDRWLVQNNLGSAASVSQYSSSYYGGVSSLSIYVGTTVTTSSAAYMFQRIESQNIADLAGQTVTLSFYAAATATGGTLSANITVSYPSALDNWTSFTTPINLSFSITSSPTRFTKTFTLPSQCTNGAQILITASNTGSSASLFSMNIGAVQLEAGAVATPFEQQPIGHILALCQRYYETKTPYGLTGMMYTSNGDTRCFIPWAVTKRTTPTVTYTGTTSVIGTGNAGTAANITLGTLTLSGNKDGAYITTSSNYSAFSSVGSVMSWGDNGLNSLVFYGSAEL